MSTTGLTSVEFVNIAGERVSVAPVAKAKAAKLAPPDDPVDAFGVRGKSAGFAVVGYSPEHWAARVREYEFALAANKEEPNIHKHPGTLDDFTASWMRKNKPKRARSKPYEIASAADACAELMRNAGWLHVRVEELVRR